MTIEQVLPINTVLQGDSLQVIKTLPTASIRMIFTSPPYMALRDYDVEGQIGLEGSSEEYLEKLWAVFDECYRVLADDGVAWINLGDTFAGNNTWRERDDLEGTKQGTYRFANSATDRTLEALSMQKELPAKCLMMIPERLAWGMVQRNWILRAKIVWFKPNGMIESSKDRPKLDYEMLYMFSKQQKYWFNYIEAKKPLKTVTVKRNAYAVGMSQKFHTLHDSPAWPVNFSMNKPIGGTRRNLGEDGNGNPKYSGNEWKPHDGMAKIGSVWGLPPESIWSITPKTFGHEYCETCDILVNSRKLLFKCKDCQTVYGKLKPADILKANNLDPETPCLVCGRSLKRHLTLNGKGRVEGLQPEVIDCGYFDLPELQIDGCPKCKSKKRDLVCPACSNKVHMHFAMFPEELVAPAIRMTCPDQVCSKCGKARYPVYTPTEEYSKLLGQGWHDHSDDEQAGQLQEKLVPAAKADYRISEWTKCTCEAAFVPGICLDPFAGFNTVGAVAMKHGRNFLTIDIDIRNVKAGMKRVEPFINQTRLF